MRVSSVGQAGTQIGFLRSGATLECGDLSPLWFKYESANKLAHSRVALKASERSSQRGCGSGKRGWSSRRASGGNLHHALCSKACSRAHTGGATPPLLQHKSLQALKKFGACISDRRLRQ